MWLYTCNSQSCDDPVSSGTLVFGAGSPDEGGEQDWPLDNGEYRAYLLPEDGYTSVAFSDVFIVTGGEKTECGENDAVTPPSDSIHTVPVDGSEVKSIMFSSCYKPNSQSGDDLWKHVANRNPDVWVWLGDNMYCDGTSMECKRLKYNEARDNQYYKSHIIDNSIAVTGTWDDHDFASNNHGKHYTCREESQAEFAYHFNLGTNDPRHPLQGVNQRKGIYHSYMFSMPGGKNGIHLINLDARYHRSPTFKDYGLCEGAESDMLGSEQWSWLEHELSQTSEIKIISSGTQVLPPTHNGRDKSLYCAYDGAGGTFLDAITEVGESWSDWDGTHYESWGEIPQSRARLLKLCQKAINDGKSKHIIFISGDQHWAEIMAKKMPPTSTMQSQVLYEVTASGIDQNWPMSIPNSNRVRVRSADKAVDGLYHKECNFPFIYEGVKYNDCVSGSTNTSWCATETDSNFNMLEWGYCLADEKNEIVSRSDMTYQGMNTCTDNFHHTCSARANYGSIDVDWEEGTISLSIFTPHEFSDASSSITLHL